MLVGLREGYKPMHHLVAEGAETSLRRRMPVRWLKVRPDIRWRDVEPRCRFSDRMVDPVRYATQSRRSPR